MILFFPLAILRNLCDAVCFCVNSKIMSHFYCKIVAKKQPFNLWLFGESTCFSACTLSCVTIKHIELNWLCKHNKKIKSSQDFIITNSFTYWSFCLWVLLWKLTLLLESFKSLIKYKNVDFSNHQNFFTSLFSNPLHIWCLAQNQEFPC